MDNTPLLAFLLFAFDGIVISQRVVETQKGPLIRVEGSHVTISCKVTGYEGTGKQNFHWSFYLPTMPNVELQIVSTGDLHFTYAVYRHRVKTKDIYIERTSKDSVFLHITKLQLRDQGEYECYTPSTESTYYGIYSDKANLTVVPDTLQARMPAQHISKTIGDSLRLSCDVTKQNYHHTHLSVSWMLETQKGTFEIISLSKDFILQSSDAFHHRLEVGGLRLDRIGPSTFNLTILYLQLSDQGKIYCQVTEWIQDPDKSWYPFSTKHTESTEVFVIGKQQKSDPISVASETNETVQIQGIILHAGSLCSGSEPATVLQRLCFLVILLLLI
ncbi:immunoglobulin superfamily member 2-like [Erpetoichthys calabaricus]|uniref:immunoglobulin superfamily member 2-like n=1 Tax=Erpetoichthys calabaricus TaxID=27687 RepID=UPI0022347025|nr:immunoglobulin superfamily member 2-like [Erpetoichthys calabaricus]